MDTETADQPSQETLLAKHRQEKKELQSKIQALKKTVTKGDKKKHKQVLEEITKLETDLKAQQELELKNFESTDTPKVIVEEEENIPEIGDLSVNSDQKVSKAQKRRNKKDQANKEREQRITEQEVENENSSRNVETQKIKEKLKEKGLMIYEIPSDGDCLYAAINHGLTLIGAPPIGIKSLRSLTSQYILENPNDFLPFLCDPATGDPLSEESLADYCAKIASTKQWGGQLELGALAEVTKQSLVVVQADGPDLVMGEHYWKDTKIILTYHRHMYHLGEHYNSVQQFVEPDEL